MIGYFSDAAGSQSYPFPGMGLLYPMQGNYISLVSRPQDWQPTRRLKAVMSSASSLPVYSINAPAFTLGIDFSDHLNFWKYEIPAVMITDTAFHRNTEYHRAGDTFDRLDYRRMAQVVHGLYAYCMMQSAYKALSHAQLGLDGGQCTSGGLFTQGDHEVARGEVGEGDFAEVGLDDDIGFAQFQSRE
jgi:Peptidase family M28